MQAPTVCDSEINSKSMYLRFVYYEKGGNSFTCMQAKYVLMKNTEISLDPLDQKFKRKHYGGKVVTSLLNFGGTLIFHKPTLVYFV